MFDFLILVTINKLLKIDSNITETLKQLAKQYNNRNFIDSDPISIPHLFKIKQDIEISGFFAAIFSWGLRNTIIKKSKLLMQMMENSPYDFVKNHQEHDLKRLVAFKHRTFNTTDLLFCIARLKHFYHEYESLERVFIRGVDSPKVKDILINFHLRFFDHEFAPQRTRKHIPTPIRNSACKRLCMYLRWMVRKDTNGVDFGIWNKIAMSDLICPLDTHVSKIARQYGLLQRKKDDWQAAEELTQNLKLLNPLDPVVFDFALFGLGVMQHKK